MKTILLVCMVAVSFAAPSSKAYKDKDVQLLSYENNNIGLGHYKYSFSQSDGTQQEQQGELTNDNILVVRGSYSWIAPNGYKYTVTYVANENGYQSDLEEAPGVNPALVASLLG